MKLRVPEIGSTPEDAGLLRVLSSLGIKANRCELKQWTPEAKHYFDQDTKQNIALFSALPEILRDGRPIEPVWYKKHNKILSGLNVFDVAVDAVGVSLSVAGKAVAWSPQVSLKGRILTCSAPKILAIDPDNPNYNENVIEWDYGICIRRLRIIEGAILELYIFPVDPRGDVVIKSNWQGNITPCRPWSRDSSTPLPMPLGITVVGDEKRIPALSFKNKVYPLLVDDSLTVYSTASDGQIGYAWGAWATIHDNSGATYTPSTTDTTVMMHASMQPTNVYAIFRGFVFFDTSSLGAGATISAATLSLFGQNQANQSGGDYATTYIVEGVQHDPLVGTDYGDELSKVTSGGSISYASFSIVAYNDITLNATGRGWINKTGTTKFCTKIGGDFNNTAPTSNYWNYIGFWANEKGAGYLPKLVVTYTMHPLITDSLALADIPSLRLFKAITDALALADIPRPKAKVSAVDSLALADLWRGPTRYESFDGQDSATTHSYGAGRDAQTFKPSISHTITKVVLRLYRGATATGTWVVEILAVGADGKPTGAALTSGTIDSETLPAGVITWATIAVTPYSLKAGTTYAIALSSPDGGPTNPTSWYSDGVGGYANGAYYYTVSPDGGAWIGPYSTWDLKFEEWGEIGLVRAMIGLADSLSLADIVIAVLPPAILYKLVTDSLSLAEVLALKARLAVADSLGLADIPLLRLFKAVSDSLALAEAPGLKAQLALLDSLALAEALGIKRGITVADAIALGELTNIKAFLMVTESMSLSDIAALRLFKAVADALALSDILGLRATLIVSDALALAEAAALRARLLLADSLSLAESLAILNRVRLADALSLADMLALKARLTQADSLALLGLPAIRVSLSVTETLALAEAIARQVNISVQDSLALVDFIEALRRRILVSDSVKVSDAVSVWLKFRYAQYLALPKALPKKPVFRV